MASEKNGFSFTWIIENFDYSWDREYDRIKSPSFIVNGIDKSKWHLVIGEWIDDDFPKFFFHRESFCKGPEWIEVDAELEYLKADGSSLSSDIYVNLPLSPGDTCILFDHKVIEEGFRIDKQTFFPRGTLKVRCTLWKSREEEEMNREEMEKSVWCLGRTIIGVKRRSFNWVNFIQEKSNYRIMPESEDEIDISLNLLSKGQLHYIRIRLITDIKSAMYMTFKYALITANGNSLEWGEKEFHFSFYSTEAEFPLQISTEELAAKMSLCLPNDDLTLQCECAYSTRIVYQQIESIDYSPFSNQPENYAENALPDPLRALKDNLSSLYSESFLSDVKLKTNTSTHPAHKAVLSARSPVFKTMFQTEMREKIGQCVEIPDLDEETVRLMLQFMYTADLKDLRWNSACQLYEAADKYEILSLKKICTSFLVSNLSVTNACELLALFDMHQDADQKLTVQEFILNRDAEFFSSDEWNIFTETNTKLAADTMVLKFKKLAEMPHSTE
ncbi:TD and POZ domain-containing protein 1-like [Caerostris extrusa]|uniref:TD and POZ domain-containing protein 1-like n=1 Tax=Caerostris extrusa TaxID=172846 RepID=A0AAV4RKA0_CAEEX|nr:TD and POZ domain-containing protein 1-like [Caerostris extrusa]